MTSAVSLGAQKMSQHTCNAAWSKSKLILSVSKKKKKALKI